MSTQAFGNTVQKFSSLRRAMRSNGAFSGLSGMIMLLDARPLATFVGLNSPIILIMLGAILLFYATALFVVAGRPQINRRLAQSAIALDIAWVIGSAVILLAGWPSLTVAGNWTVVLLAEAVATFAIWQAFALRQRSRSK